ncbi:unnamed protein product [Arctia plantaginis]|uniref:Malate dehydrogenase, mitochondrial n=1 Tax=Arctia plantaginis TaxID=874455 RepID=A0A8S0ZD71_ARCPL|nr:unnamed protein product [Arctia plantaginis]
MLSNTRGFWSHVVHKSKSLNNKVECVSCRHYVNRPSKDDCRRAVADIPDDPPDKICKKPCVTKTKKPGILHRIKLKVLEGGSNFGTPFRMLKCKEPEREKPPKALPPPKKPAAPVPVYRHGMQVSILGADTRIGQYVALLLKQCPCIKKLRLYEAMDTKGCTRNVCQVVHDLQHINTNCLVEPFSCACCELERCLQNSDIVLILESGYVNMDMKFEQRFYCQAPLVKCYADAIANECPRAFIIVCASPIDCMVPLVAETLKETGWYNPRKLLGSVAVPEMRASTLAACALALEPRYTRVPCVGGTEGASLVPLFSRAVEFFEFAENNAMLMTDAVRCAPTAVKRVEGNCSRAADLSEAHALANLVTSVAHGLLCHDVPIVSGFVESDPSQVISPARYISNHLEITVAGVGNNLGLPKMTDSETALLDLAVSELYSKQKMVEECEFSAQQVVLSGTGIVKQFDLPSKLSSLELEYLANALDIMRASVRVAKEWHAEYRKMDELTGRKIARTNFLLPKHYDHVDDCITCNSC